MPHFDLIDEPWLPCVGSNGAVVEIGLRSALLDAHRLRELSDPSPLVTVALHRLLLAILHRNFGPQSVAVWKHLWERAAFDGPVLEKYFDSLRPRFDLFDDERPFYQVAELDPSRATRVDSPTALMHEAKWVNNTLFDHSAADPDFVLRPAQAARYLVAFQAFAMGGLMTLQKGEAAATHKYADNAPLVKGAVALVQGASLFETLMLNLHLYDGKDQPFTTRSTDLPAWERAHPAAVEERKPTGYLDFLTWQSRRIRLLPEDRDTGGGGVSRVLLMKGAQFPDGISRRGMETMLTFIANPGAKGKEDPWPALAFKEGRAVWRDSLAICRAAGAADGAASDPPRTLTWLHDLVAEGVIDRGRLVPIDLLGLSTDRAKVLFWRHERVLLPLAYLDDDRLFAKLRLAVALAEKAAARVSGAAWTLAELLVRDAAEQKQKPPAQEIRPVVEHLGFDTAYWARLDRPFRALIVELANDRVERSDGLVEYGARILPHWARTLRRSAWEAFAEGTRDLNTSARSLKAVARAEATLNRGLAVVLGPIEELVKEEAS